MVENRIEIKCFTMAFRSNITPCKKKHVIFSKTVRDRYKEVLTKDFPIKSRHRFNE